MENKKTILVTGGLGYIGSHTVVELGALPDKYEVVILDNISNASIKILEKLEKMVSRKLKYYSADLLNTEELEKVFKENEFYAVIHFAAKKSVGESMTNPLLYYKNNVTGTLNLIELCLKYNVNNFIFSSSACVYGNRNDNAKEDESDLRPINPYGKTKLMMETILQDVARANTNFKTVILRYCNPVSAHKSGIIGENPTAAVSNLFPVIENHIRGKSEKIFVFGNDYNTPDGTAIRDYVHVADIAKGHIIALDCFGEKKDLMKNNTVIYNMGTDNGYSVMDVINTYIKAANANINFEITGRREGDAERSLPDCNKIKKELGWIPLENLETMCKDSYNWVIKCDI